MFDADGLFGYGGYSHHPRSWQKTVKQFYNYYQLNENSSILDIGCAQGYVLCDFKQLNSDITLWY